ncbi:RNA polymerase sigma factor [Hymenobacter sp. BT770]|uniref:RNA polymerase sigma factor n=1 Tax=Hymenobacter sp. BT770 TaxID=2886942 RepID=UPI001D101560|nr:RNA polymerase sigma factor [Hymenobacter sp. BT770]MCC3152953.1 RNA polymerase sigma factor [Hymenobacter sp. BT770]MDO3415133.1 RNA polymerase sigma factor [Hymenobacter sp. BT770]
MIPPLAVMPFVPLTDSEVIHRVLAGEKKLFELLMRRYNQRLYRTGIAMLGHPAAAEEAMQNAWVKAYEQLAKFEERASFPTWLTRIMLNECLMDRRRQQRLVDLDDDTAEDAPDQRTAATTPLQNLLNEELREALEAAVESLPEMYRSVFVLREVEGMSVHETADALHLTEANVKVRLLRARERLRNQLAQFAPQQAFAYLGPRCDNMVHHVLARLGAQPWAPDLN